MYQLYHGDCFEVMDRLIKDGVVVDAIIVDLPYNTTSCKFDKEVIDLEKMWNKIGRLVKNKNTPIIMFGAMPFTAKLVSSNIKGYKHHWIWEKDRGTGFQVAKYRPMMKHEDIITFTYKGDKVNYYPQMIKREKPIKYKYSSKTKFNLGTDKEQKQLKYMSDTKYPCNIITINKVTKPIHPTQKPVELLEYLIKTYTNEGELVLDFTMGSGSTGVACLNTNRRFIGIELDEEYFNMAKNRIENINN